MNLELFIAGRIQFSKAGKRPGTYLSRPATRIASAGIALGLATMIIAMAVITGFKQEIRSKLVGFGSHIQITAYNNNDTYETNPIRFAAGMEDMLSGIQGVRHVDKFCTKPVILKTDSSFQGMVLKGVVNDFDWTFFKKNLKAGALPLLGDSSASNDVLISARTASAMRLDTGDRILAYFIGDDIRVRKFTVAGIYETGLQQFDNLFIIGDMRHIQKLNGWDDDQYSGMEITVDDFGKIDDICYEAFKITANRFEEDGGTYLTRSIKQLQPQIFAWLDMLDLNVAVILVLMTIVAGFNIISGLLILILDKTNMIGILKAMGARDRRIRKIFIFQSAFIVGKGLFWGNIAGLSLCAIQYFFHVLPLDADVYFVDYVPVSVKLLHVLALNVLAGGSAMLALVAPSQIISRISPVKAMRFE